MPAPCTSTALLAAWLQLQLEIDVDLEVTTKSHGSSGIQGVRLERDSGQIVLERTLANVATLVQPNQPTHDISLPRRSLRDCLAEELRRLDPDDLFGKVIQSGLSQLGKPGSQRRSGSRQAKAPARTRKTRSTRT